MKNGRPALPHMPRFAPYVPLCPVLRYYNKMMIYKLKIADSFNLLYRPKSHIEFKDCDQSILKHRERCMTEQSAFQGSKKERPCYDVASRWRKCKGG